MTRNLVLRSCFLLFALLHNVIHTTAEPPVINDIQDKISLSNDSKLKRQNEGDVERLGEEVDLTGISENGQPNQPGQPGSAGIPQQSGQSPIFGNGNNFFPQQPFFNNGLGFNGSPQNGFPQGGGFQGFPQGFPQGFQQGFPQGFPQGGFQQNYPQFGQNGRNVILQNNGKQYLVQPLNANQRVVQKNGKQYLLQPLTNAAGINGQTFNVPNAAFSTIPSFNQAGNPNLQSLQNGIFNGNGGFSAGAPQTAYPPFSPAVAAVQPSAVATNAKLTSTVPQRVIVGSTGNRFEVEQLPIRNGDANPYLTSAIGAISAQLALPGNAGLLQAYSRANAAGYGQYPTSRALDVSDLGSEPVKRDVRGLKN